LRRAGNVSYVKCLGSTSDTGSALADLSGRATRSLAIGPLVELLTSTGHDPPQDVAEQVGGLLGDPNETRTETTGDQPDGSQPG
jgi:hypothetical protein